MGRMTAQGNKETGWIRIEELDLKPPSLRDNTADQDRLLRAIRRVLGEERVTCPLGLARRIPTLLRSLGYRINAALFEEMGIWHLIDLFPPDEDVSLFGIAMDLGTTTVVLELIDLRNKQTVSGLTFHNPQIKAGADILSRIHFAGSTKDGLAKLQGMLIEGINKHIADQFLPLVGAKERIVAMSAAGNTTMTHLFLALNPYWICREPYIPAANRFQGIRAEDIGLEINPLSPVHIFPNVGSYFGGDLIAGILSSGMAEREEVSILVDVGTNAEVVVGNRDWLMACAGAAGPALEGGVASIGMMAGPGAIDKVRIDPRTGVFKINTIEGKAPVGICGSGLIDLTAQLYLAGMLDIRGKFVKDRCGERLKESDGINYLIIVPAEETASGKDLTLSQPDIDALMRSKAAMYTILTTITNTVNIPIRSLERFYVAGTFGSYIDPSSAITIGMLPDLPLTSYVPLGNTSLKGAREALLSRKAAIKADELRDRITYMELNVNQEFMNLFSAAKFIPHTDRSLFPSVRGPYIQE
jgi:uncharacterized 2Fe-2S/4Fe-4S cluster protein (DUF4445 family)